MRSLPFVGSTLLLAVTLSAVYAIPADASSKSGSGHAGRAAPHAKALPKHDLAAQKIVLASMAHLKTASSFHLLIGERFEQSTAKTHGKFVPLLSITGVGDTQLVKPYDERAWLTGYAQILAGEPRTGIAISELQSGGMRAEKQGKNKPWTCTTHIQHSANLFTMPFTFLAYPGKYPKLVNLGPATVQGVAVWHIRGSGAISFSPSPGGSGSPLVHAQSVANYFVAKSDGTLRKVNGQAIYAQPGSSDKSARTRVAMWAKLSRYGEKFTVKLPSACAGTR